MRLACPHCGERSLDEFVYSGDATVNRPDSERPDAMELFVRFTFQRANPPGPHRELWYHAAGCHAWLVISRNISTHEVLSVESARDVALNKQPAA